MHFGILARNAQYPPFFLAHAAGYGEDIYAPKSHMQGTHMSVSGVGSMILAGSARYVERGCLTPRTRNMARPIRYAQGFQ